MNNITIDGVRYVPVTTISDQTNRLSKILKSRSWMSDDEKNRIIDEFSNGFAGFEKKSSKSQKAKSKKSEKSSKKKLFNYSNFKELDDEGHVVFKRGRYTKSEWTIPQVVEIKQWVNFGKMNGDKINSLSKRLGLNTVLIYKIIENLKYGDLDHWINRWVDKNVSIKKSETPIENNPQKRKDLGWF